MTHVLYVYGTLRPGGEETVRAKGTMYDLGPFPGIRLEGNNEFTCERVEIENLHAIDLYEGFDPANPEMSLYIRKPFLDGFIYEINRPVDDKKVVASGDWLAHRQEKRGRYGSRFG